MTQGFLLGFAATSPVTLGTREGAPGSEGL